MARQAFTMTANLRSGDSVTFGLLGQRVWIRVEKDDRIFSSLDNGRTLKLAAELVPVEMWPAFANHLKPVVQDAALFEWT